VTVTFTVLALLRARRAFRQARASRLVVSLPSAEAAVAAALPDEGELVSAPPAAPHFCAYSQLRSAAREQQGELAESLLPRPAMRIYP
jgi:hypothetical protein